MRKNTTVNSWRWWVLGRRSLRIAIGQWCEDIFGWSARGKTNWVNIIGIHHRFIDSTFNYATLFLGKNGSRSWILIDLIIFTIESSKQCASLKGREMRYEFEKHIDIKQVWYGQRLKPTLRNPDCPYGWCITNWIYHEIFLSDFEQKYSNHSS